MGSYALVDFKEGVVEKWEIQDIYTPDGQIKGHIEPKAPLQQAFLFGSWRLPNSNWELDYKIAAEDILWFFESANITGIDGVVAINFDFIKSLLGIVGEVKPHDFPEVVREDNFYEIAQSYSEEDFFPGSHKKKNYLSGMGNVLFSGVLNSNIYKKIMIMKLITKQLDEKQILVFSKNNKVAKLVQEKGWDGTLGEYEFDYLYSAESNLGSNKANCCVERIIEQNVTIDNKVNSEITISITNNNPNTDFKGNGFGGTYINYHRLVLPNDADVARLSVNGKMFTKSSFRDPNKPPNRNDDFEYEETVYDSFKELGFWVIVPVQETSVIQLTYLLPYSNKYSVYIKRQPGIYQLPYILTVNNDVIVNKILKEDMLVSKKL
jgi:hypothetical protein